MFCPKCKAIISKKRINNQLVEFCNCPDKLESNYIATVEQPARQPKKQFKITPEGQIINIKEKNTKTITTIQESVNKEKRLPSEYANLPLDLRISNNARLPSFWKQTQVQERLLKQTEERYERYYRKIEDAFKDSGLGFFISFLPNETLTEFFVDYWGLAFKSKEFTIFYAGTKLNDLASWESKVLEKESDVILPYRLFSSYSRKLDFDRITLKQLVEILQSDWLKLKDTLQLQNYQLFSMTELYSNFKQAFFGK